MTDHNLQRIESDRVPDVYRRFPSIDYAEYSLHRSLPATRLSSDRDEVLEWAWRIGAKVAMTGIIVNPFTFELGFSTMVFLDNEDFALFKLTFPGRATIERNA